LFEQGDHLHHLKPQARVALRLLITIQSAYTGLTIDRLVPKYACTDPCQGEGLSALWRVVLKNLFDFAYVVASILCSGSLKPRLVATTKFEQSQIQWPYYAKHLYFI
jgi:hypothetical protein